MSNEYKNKLVYTRDGDEHGVATGATHRCQMEGCNGLRVSVKWPNGKNTRPCSRGLKDREDGNFQIM